MSAETKVGLFTFFGLVLLGLSVFLLGNFTFSHGYEVKVYFQNAAGLPNKSKVKLSGVDAGKVKSLRIEGDKVAVIVRIDKSAIVYKDSKFSIAASSIIGANFLQIEQGTPAAGVLADGDTVWGISQPSITDMLSQTMSSIQNLTGGGGDMAQTLSNLRQLSGNLNELILSLRPHLASSMQEVSELTRASNDLMRKIDDGAGLFGALVEDGQMKADVQETLANVKQISEDAKAFIGKMAKFRMFWLYDVRYQPDGNFFQSDLGVKIVSNNGFTYYRAGIAHLGNRDNTPKEGDYSGKPNQIDARLGFYNKWVDLSLGMIRGSGGGVLELKPFFAAPLLPLSTLAVYGEVADFGRDRVVNGYAFDRPLVSIGAKFDVTKNLNLGVRYNDMLVDKARALQITGGVSFEDKELAALLGLATLAN